LNISKYYLGKVSKKKNISKEGGGKETLLTDSPGLEMDLYDFSY
jgi:hypothetical protein